MENMQRCIDWYLPPEVRDVIDLGASDVNGSCRSLMPADMNYLGLDLEDGPGVDRVMADPYQIPFHDASVDLVLSGQMLEHCAHFWRVFTEIARVLRPEGLAFIIAPSAGPIHRYPVDCYRFYPDSFQALAEWSGLRLVHCWLDERGPWRDLVGVFQKGGTLQQISAPPRAGATAPLNVVHNDPAEEMIQGARPYRDVLARIHDLLNPALYVEIGIRKGESLALAKADSIGIDPEPDLPIDLLRPRMQLHQSTSDDFFFFAASSALSGRKINLGFIDGMHLAEYALRDFMNLERHMATDGVIIIDDVLPNRPVQGERTRQSRVWCGDVWRIVPVLRQMRPDVRMTLLDTSPSGMLVISGLNPTDRTLWDNYNPCLRAIGSATPSVPFDVLTRKDVLAPDEGNIRRALGLG